jgi:alcohol dehydrogenase
MQKGLNGSDARRILVDTLRSWEQELGLPQLAAYGIGADDLARIVAASRGSSMKTNPIVLTDAELTHVLASRL